MAGGIPRRSARGRPIRDLAVFATYDNRSSTAADDQHHPAQSRRPNTQRAAPSDDARAPPAPPCAATSPPALSDAWPVASLAAAAGSPAAALPGDCGERRAELVPGVTRAGFDDVGTVRLAEDLAGAGPVVVLVVLDVAEDVADAAVVDAGLSATPAAGAVIAARAAGAAADGADAVVAVAAPAVGAAVEVAAGTAPALAVVADSPVVLREAKEGAGFDVDAGAGVVASAETWALAAAAAITAVAGRAVGVLAAGFATVPMPMAAKARCTVSSVPKTLAPSAVAASWTLVGKLTSRPMPVSAAGVMAFKVCAAVIDTARATALNACCSAGGAAL